MYIRRTVTFKKGGNELYVRGNFLMSENCFGRLSSVNKNVPRKDKTAIICNRVGIILLLGCDSSLILMIVCYVPQACN